MRRLRLPVSVHSGRCRALVPRSRRALGGRGTRGHLPDDAPVGPRRAGRAKARRARRRGEPAAGAVHRERAPTHLAAARVRAWSVRAPGAEWTPLRRRPHLLVSLLLAARRGCDASARALWPGGRLARGLESLLLA